MRLILFFLFSLSVTWGEDVTFMAYNLRNFLETNIYTDGKKSGTRYKPAEEIQALTEIIGKEKPDILGICEIGTEKDLKKLRDLLKEEKLDYPHFEHVKAADSVRHLALLSRYPIKKVHSREDMTYSIEGKKFPLRRGLLHVELELHGKTVHALGVHFKSKRPTKEADEAEMRLQEARLVRGVMTDLLTEKPETLLFLYGDINDSYKSKTTSTVKGHWNSKVRVNPLELKDSRGEYWTHYWSWQREYGVFDYVFCNPALMPHVVKEKSYLIDSPNVLTASDHRPLLVTFSF